MQFRVFCPFSKIKNVFSYFSFGCFTVSLPPKPRMLPFFIKVSFSINDHKMKKSTNHPHPSTLHPQKLTINLLLKNNRICKHMTNFKVSSPLRVDAADVWSLYESILKKSEWKDRRFEILNFSFLSITRFFYLSRKMLLWLGRCLLKV